MKILASLCIALLLLTTLAVGAQFQLEIEKTLLPNSLTLLTYVDTTVPTVSYLTFINAGSRDETRPGATGIAHVLEHMMFRGTDQYPDHGEAIAHMGAQKNAYTTRDYMCFFVNAKAEFLREIIDVESDRVQNMRFTEETFRRELGSVREERRRTIEDDPSGYLYMQLYRLAYTRHTYHHPVLGWEDDLEKTLTFEDAEAFKNVFFAPNYCTIVICGNFDADQAAEWVFERYGGWKKSLPPTSQVRSERQQQKRRRKDLEWKDSHAAPRLLLAYGGPDLNLYTPDLVSLQVLSKILFSETGRLHRELVSQSGLVDEIQAEIDGAKDPALFTIDATLSDVRNLDSVLAVIERELDTVANSPVSDDELARAINQMRSDFLFDLDTPFGIGEYIGYYHLTGGDYRMMFKHYEMLSAITAADIIEAARKYLVRSNSTVVTLAPLTVN